MACQNLQEKGREVPQRMSLKKWFEDNWVDISRKKKGGGHPKCGRKKASTSRKGYPKCVPAAVIAKMTDSQKKSAVRKKTGKGPRCWGQPMLKLLPGRKRNDLQTSIIKIKRKRRLEHRPRIFSERENLIGDFQQPNAMDNPYILARLGGEIASFDRIYQTLKDEPAPGNKTV